MGQLLVVYRPWWFPNVLQQTYSIFIIRKTSQFYKASLYISFLKAGIPSFRLWILRSAIKSEKCFIIVKATWLQHGICHKQAIKKIITKHINNQNITSAFPLSLFHLFLPNTFKSSFNKIMNFTYWVSELEETFKTIYADIVWDYSAETRSPPSSEKFITF